MLFIYVFTFMRVSGHVFEQVKQLACVLSVCSELVEASDLFSVSVFFVLPGAN